ncbi:hypothetical protein PMIN06_002686 [Paraphaeosphaeria minitans]|uniref:Uncharacterized protein n=1 Tax=Paraphaeosphaeria minitans TaxID=565426 RepID=A0A9P6GJQ1_9PLEO|nr:hypothetical protein PMIN01_04432 [Paraphaeosphaeria minitans]
MERDCTIGYDCRFFILCAIRVFHVELLSERASDSSNVLVSAISIGRQRYVFFSLFSNIIIFVTRIPVPSREALRREFGGSEYPFFPTLRLGAWISLTDDG